MGGENLKDNIRSFAADYSRRFNLDKVAVQRLIEAELERAVKAEDSGAISIVKAGLATLQLKYQALAVRARLKMSCEATNMDQELRIEELGHAVDRHIASVTSPDEQCLTTIEAICWKFCEYLVKLFTR